MAILKPCGEDLPFPSKEVLVRGLGLLLHLAMTFEAATAFISPIFCKRTSGLYTEIAFWQCSFAAQMAFQAQHVVLCGTSLCGRDRSQHPLFQGSRGPSLECLGCLT